jgi:alkylated DNA repair dioxygenase AlkB
VQVQNGTDVIGLAAKVMAFVAGKGYPVDDLETPAGSAVVDRCRTELAANGACDLVGFIRREAAERIVEEAMTVRPDAHRTETRHNIEFSGKELELASDDPLRIQVRSAKWGAAYDQIPQSSPLRALYESDALTRFVGAALEIDPLYRHADALGALNVMYYDSGDELGWHFDNADFVVTLLLQQPTAGGVFEYVSNLRRADDANPDGVRALLDGNRSGIRTMSGQAGTLALFRGHLSPHRVTPVEGDRPRVNAVLSYARIPDARISDHGRKIFYGRTSAG